MPELEKMLVNEMETASYRAGQLPAKWMLEACARAASYDPQQSRQKVQDLARLLSGVFCYGDHEVPGHEEGALKLIINAHR